MNVLEEELLPVEKAESGFVFTQDRLFLNSVIFDEVLNDDIDFTDETDVELECIPIIKLKLKLKK